MPATSWNDLYLNHTFPNIAEFQVSLLKLYKETHLNDFMWEHNTKR